MDEIFYLIVLMIGIPLLLVFICVVAKRWGEKYGAEDPSVQEENIVKEFPQSYRSSSKSTMEISFFEKTQELDDLAKKELATAHLYNVKNSTKYKKQTIFPISVSMNDTTRVAKIKFVERQYYRTIERYVQRNYVKTPIYSDWKVKEKYFEEKIQLKNDMLEHLQAWGSPNISAYALDIIAMLPNPKLFPSWALKIYLMEARNHAIGTVRDTYYSYESKQLNIIAQTQELLDQQNLIKKKADKKAEKHNKKSEKGIFKNFHERSAKKQMSISLNAENNIKNYTERITCQKQDLEMKKAEKKAKIDLYTQKHDLFVSQITFLPPERISRNGFTPLKAFVLADYRKIIGCYVIRNRENGKCYVGQSKDVMRRIKQHFNGTVPKNQVFSEDYYTSSMKSKEDMFEVFVFETNEKGSLDSKERELIEKYNSYGFGYNRTSGNQ